MFPGGWLHRPGSDGARPQRVLLRNICGGAKLVDGQWVQAFTDRGWLQMTDTLVAEREWLARPVPGCPNG